MHIPTDYIYICGERSAEGGREPVVVVAEKWVTLTLDVLGILLMDDWTTEIGCFRSSLI